jgi:hypothetical protein
VSIAQPGTALVEPTPDVDVDAPPRHTSQKRVALYLLLPADAVKAEPLIATQEAFAREHGNLVTRFYEQPDSYRDRPRLHRMLARAEVGGIDVLSVFAIGSLAPSRIGALRIVRDLDALSVKVVSFAERWFDVHAPPLAWIIEGERRLLARSARVIRRKRRRGERVGTVPYGSHLALDGRTIEPDRSEQSTLAEACALREGGASMREIARRLTDAGHRSRNGTAFSKTQIGRMLLRARGPA